MLPKRLKPPGYAFDYPDESGPDLHEIFEQQSITAAYRERRVVAAVLISALADLNVHKHLHAPSATLSKRRRKPAPLTPSGPTLAEEAREWFLSEDPASVPFSFAWVCEQLQLSDSQVDVMLHRALNSKREIGPNFGREVLR